MGCSASSSAALNQTDITTSKKESTTLGMGKFSSKEQGPPRTNKVAVFDKAKTVRDHFGASKKVHVEQRPVKNDTIVSDSGVLPSRDITSVTSFCTDFTKENIHTQSTSSGKRAGTPKRATVPSNKISNFSTSAETINQQRTSNSSLPALNRPQSALSLTKNDISKEQKTEVVKDNPSPQTEVYKNRSEFVKATNVLPLTVEPLPAVFSKIESRSIIYIEKTSACVTAKIDNFIVTKDVQDSNSDKTEEVTCESATHISSTNIPSPIMDKDTPIDKNSPSNSSNISQISGDTSDTARLNRRRNLHHHHYRHSHHHYHNGHHPKLSVSNCSRSATPEKTIKITTKDERAQFVFKTVKSKDDSDGGSSDTRDILIQTDVISLNDNNEKTKKKLLIKMRKVGSTSIPSSITVSKKQQESTKSKNTTHKNDQVRMKNEDIVTEGGAETSDATNIHTDTLKISLNIMKGY